MPVRLSAVRTRKLPPIPMDDEGDLNIVYNRPTPEYADRAQAALSTAETSASKSVVAFLLPLIAEWDLLGDDDQPLEINEQNLLLLPQDVLTQIQSQINERENPAKNEETPPTISASETSS
jgi:hypothetical protein